MDSLILLLVLDAVDMIFMYPFLRLVSQEFKDVIDGFPHLKKYHKELINEPDFWFISLIPYPNLMIFTTTNLTNYHPQHLNYIIKAGCYDHPVVWKIIESLPDHDFAVSCLLTFVENYSCLKPNKKLYKFLVSQRPWSLRSTNFREKFLKKVILNEKWELLRPNYFTGDEMSFFYRELRNDRFSLEIFKKIDNIRQYVTTIIFYQIRVDRMYAEKHNEALILAMLKKGNFDLADLIYRNPKHHYYDFPQQKLMTNVLKGCCENVEGGLMFLQKHLNYFHTTFNPRHYQMVCKIKNENLVQWYIRST